MRWEKLGHVFAPAGEHAWMQTHAANAFAEHRHGDVFRVYFTCRDERSRSHVAWVDVALRPPYEVHALSDEPVLAPGEPGLFDDSGCALGCIVETDGRRRLYYLGWNLAVTVPWRNSIGMAEWREPEQRFVKHGRAPIIDRSNEDPFTISYPWIIASGDGYEMWYGSNLRWGSDQSQMDHVVKHARSADGVTWQREEAVAVGLVHPGEYALSKPIVLRDDDRFRMWYSYRANGSVTTYRIGYAESRDGRAWERRDGEAGIDVSSGGWDSEMICYPFVFDHDGRRYMLYNGNGYGRTGFGLAVLVEDDR